MLHSVEAKARTAGGLIRRLALAALAVAALGAAPAAARSADALRPVSDPVSVSVAPVDVVAPVAPVAPAAPVEAASAPAADVGLDVQVFEATPGALAAAAGRGPAAVLGVQAAVDMRALQARGVLAPISRGSFAARSGQTVTVRMSGQPAPDAQAAASDAETVALDLRPTVLPDLVRLEVVAHPPAADAPPAEPQSIAIKLRRGDSVLLTGVARVHDVRPSAPARMLSRIPLLGRLARHAAEPAGKDLLVLVSPRLLTPDGALGAAAPVSSPATPMTFVTAMSLPPAAKAPAASAAAATASAVEPVAHPPVAPATRLARWSGAPVRLLSSAFHYVRTHLGEPGERVVASR
jgi:hypothetical protein